MGEIHFIERSQSVYWCFVTLLREKCPIRIDNIPPCSAALPQGAFPWLHEGCPWDKVQIPSHGAGLSQSRQNSSFLGEKLAPTAVSSPSSPINSYSVLCRSLQFPMNLRGDFLGKSSFLVFFFPVTFPAVDFPLGKSNYT